MSRLIVANLDYEEELRSGRARTLPAAVAQRIAELGTLLRCFARDEDQLWTATPLNAGVMLDVPGLAHPTFISSLDPEEYDAVLSWGGPQRPLHSEGNSLVDRIWSLPTPSHGSAARVNHRRFALETAAELELPVMGHEFKSVRELRAHLTELDGLDKWVVKAPLSAAGRDRVLGRGSTIDDKAERTLENLLGLDGSAFFEPWLDRVADFGVLGVVDEERCQLIGSHVAEVDSRGGLVAITIHRELDWFPTGHPLFDSELRRVGDAVGGKLHEAGYRGPFGVDAWLFRTGDCLSLQPIGEINARLTFGHVARLLRAQIRAPMPDFEHFTLRVAGNTETGRCSLPLVGTESGPLAWAEYR